jgi:hypothetical protein
LIVVTSNGREGNTTANDRATTHGLQSKEAAVGDVGSAINSTNNRTGSSIINADGAATIVSNC